MSEIVKEKPIMEEVQKKYNNFVKSRLMMMEYEKKEAYLYGNQIMLDEERRLGIEEGIKKGKEEGIKEGKEEGIKEGKEEGIKEGIEQGEINKAKSIALKLKNMNMDNKEIVKITGLSLEDIEKL